MHNKSYGNSDLIFHNRSPHTLPCKTYKVHNIHQDHTPKRMLPSAISLPLQIFCFSQFLAISLFLFFLAKESMLCRLVLFFFFIGYQENAKYPPNKSCVSCSSHKIIWKLVYLGIEMTSLDQKHNIVRKVANLCVSKLCISFKDIKSSGELPISK